MLRISITLTNTHKTHCGPGVLIEFEGQWAARGSFVMTVHTHTSAGNSHFLSGVPRELQLGANLFYRPCAAGYVRDVTAVHHIVASLYTHTQNIHTHISPRRATQQTLGMET